MEKSAREALEKLAPELNAQLEEMKKKLQEEKMAFKAKLQVEAASTSLIRTSHCVVCAQAQQDYPLSEADLALVQFVNETLMRDSACAHVLPIGRCDLRQRTGVRSCSLPRCSRAINVANACMDGILLCKLVNHMVPHTIDDRVIRTHINSEDDVKDNNTLFLNSAKVRPRSSVKRARLF